MGVVRNGTLEWDVGVVKNGTLEVGCGCGQEWDSRGGMWVWSGMGL